MIITIIITITISFSHHRVRTPKKGDEDKSENPTLEYVEKRMDASEGPSDGLPKKKQRTRERENQIKDIIINQ